MADDQPTPIDPDALQRWINDDLGIEGRRRLVRDDGHEALVSKFDQGFAAGVHELIALMPELFDQDAVTAAYREEAAQGGLRLDAWHRGMHGMLRRASERHDITDLRQAEVRTGIDSVYAILATALWSDPRVNEPFAPGNGERVAYLDALASLSDGRDLFTRVYGQFEGRTVLNHCPGASFARVMLAQGWTACCGEPPPEVPAPGPSRPAGRLQPG